MELLIAYLCIQRNQIQKGHVSFLFVKSLYIMWNGMCGMGYVRWGIRIGLKYYKMWRFIFVVLNKFNSLPPYDRFISVGIVQTPAWYITFIQ